MRKFFAHYRRQLTVGVLLLVAFFFVRVIGRSWTNVVHTIHAPSVLWISLGFAGLAAFTAFRIIGWRYLLRRMGYPVRWREAGESLVLAEAIRYVPGNVWSVLGRVGMTARLGVPASEAFGATLFEVIALLTSSLTVGGGFAVFSGSLPVVWRVLGAGSAVLALGIAYGVPLYGKVISWLLARFHKAPVEWRVRRQTFLGLFGWACLAWIAFSLGSYWLTIAFFTTPANQLLTLLAVFPTSWFIGYISVITPSGLGVREAAMATLLAPVFGASGVVVAALSRLGMLGTELVWIIIAGSRWLTIGALQLWRWVRSPRGVVMLSCVAFAVYFAVITALMHAKVITSRFDLGNMDQVVWNTSHGHFFQATDPYGLNVVSRFAYHADLLLVLFVPLYWAWASPYVLLIVQAVIVGLGGWYAFRLAKKFLHNEWLAALLGVAYLFTPTLQRAVMFDFHSLTLGATFGLAMVLAAIERRWRSFILWGILLTFCKEELGLVVASFALFMSWRDVKNRKRWLAATAVAVAYVAVIFFGIMPATRSGQPSFYTSLYADVGASPKQLLLNAAQKPQAFFAHLAGEQARHMYAGVLGPTAFLSLASPAWLLVAWPDFVVNLFNDRFETKMLIFHYQAVIAAFTFVASVAGIAALRNRFQQRWARQRILRVSLEAVLVTLVVVATAVESVRLSPLPYSLTADARVFWSAPMAPVVHAAVATIPADASVSATNTVGAQLAGRKSIYAFPLGIGEASYILILQAPAGSIEWERNHAQAESLATDRRYELVQTDRNFSMYKKR